MPEANRPPTVVAGPRDVSPAPLPSPQDDILEDEIDFSRYFRVFARHWMLLVVFALVGAAAGFAFSRTKPVLYEGVTTVLVLPPAKVDVRTASTANFRALLENLTHSLQVITELGLDPESVVDHVSGSTPVLHDDAVQLAPYACVWLTA